MSPQSTSITDARKNIFAITDEVQQPGNYYLLTENGRSKAVIMSAEEFESWQETIEVINEFPDLDEHIKQAEQELERGDYITLEDLLAEEGYVLAEKQSNYGVSRSYPKKSKKRTRKNR